MNPWKYLGLQNALKILPIQLNKMSENNSSFLADLMKKEAYVKGIQDRTGKNMGNVIGEVERQIGQSTNSGKLGILRGVGVTKSGGDD
jgi:hypothetical protein